MDEAVRRWYKLGKLLHWGSQILPRKVVGIFNWKSYPSIFIFGTKSAPAPVVVNPYSERTYVDSLVQISCQSILDIFPFFIKVGLANGRYILYT
jgi:hypothetical protein